MSNTYFTLSDIFLDVTITPNGGVMVQNLGTMEYLDPNEYWDAKKIRAIKQNFIMVKGNMNNYYITGNLTDRYESASEKYEACKKFAIFYHKNRSKFTVIDFNS